MGKFLFWLNFVAAEGYTKKIIREIAIILKHVDKLLVHLKVSYFNVTGNSKVIDKWF